MNWIRTFETTTKQGKRKDGFLQHLEDFQSFLTRDEMESMVVAYVSVSRNRRGLPVGALFENLSERYEAEAIAIAIENLIADAWLTLDLDGPFDGMAKVNLSHTLEVALRRGEDNFLKILANEVSEQDRALLRAHSKIVSFKMRIIGRDEWIAFSEKFIQNSNESWVRTLAAESLPPLSTAMSLMVGILSLIEHSPIEVLSLCQMFGVSQVECERLYRQWSANINHGVRSKTLELLSTPMRGKLLILSDPSFKSAFDSSEEQNYNLPETLVCYRKEAIHPKKLFYNNHLRADLKILRRLMQGKNFQRYSNKMRQHGHNGGFTVMLSGIPGSGKTELARQLALESNRDLLSFDLSKQRDMYYGESEKRIKEVFDAYRQMSSDPTKAPVLFFNEADGVMQSRTAHVSTVGRTENSIQAILLNELEQFDGILVCTTNTPETMDNAYNRRFLFKLNIDLPEPNVRCQLLRHFFPHINLAHCVNLSQKHYFTGADLMNIQKRVEMERVVSRAKKDISALDLDRYLLDSGITMGLGHKHSRTPIGFNNN